MSKEIKNSLEDLAEAVIFVPNPVHRKIKVKFWSRYIPNPMSSDISLADVLEVTKDARLRKLWSQTGFQDWFLNKDENRERLEYLFTLALDTAEEVLVSTEVQAGAKVNMIKVLGELANKFPSKVQVDKFTDDDINRMNESQLQLWLEKRGVVVGSSRQIEAIEGEVLDVQKITK